MCTLMSQKGCVKPISISHHNSPSTNSSDGSRQDVKSHSDERNRLNVLAYKRLDGSHDSNLEGKINEPQLIKNDLSH